MGTFYSTHLGFYIKVPVTHKPQTNTFYRKPSGKRANTKFNPQTGEEYKQETEIINVQEYPNAYIQDRDDLNEDEFWSPPYAGVDTNEFSIFVPNSNEFNFIKCDAEYDFEQPLEYIDVESERIKFKRTYQKYLDYYKEKYPAMEVKFGIVRYGS